MKLKGCPFCGGESKITVNAQTLTARAYCEPCKVIMKRDFKKSEKIKKMLEEMMAEEWNRRDETRGDTNENSRTQPETAGTL